eukprot:760612-Hanusia_phi.AAC.4
MSQQLSAARIDSMAALTFSEEALLPSPPSPNKQTVLVKGERKRVPVALLAILEVRRARGGGAVKAEAPPMVTSRAVAAAARLNMKCFSSFQGSLCQGRDYPYPLHSRSSSYASTPQMKPRPLHQLLKVPTVFHR